MKLNNAITWLSAAYKIIETLTREQTELIDNFVDNNMPQVLSELQSFVKNDKLAFLMTNGKKTTIDIFNQILEASQKTYITNVDKSGKIYPCLTSIMLDVKKKAPKNDQEMQKDYYSMAFLETQLLKYFSSMKFDYLILGNLFVDQKDSTSLIEKKRKIQEALVLNSKLNLLINADEPMFESIDDISNDIVVGVKRKKVYFGFENVEVFEDVRNTSHDNDILICPKCGCHLPYRKRYYSHLGEYSCECGFKRPKLDISANAKVFADYSFLDVLYKGEKYSFKVPLGGVYNAYNALCAISLAFVLGFKRKAISQAFENYSPVEFRDQIFEYKNKKIKLKTVVNPTSLTESLRELAQVKNVKVVFAFNDKPEDGFNSDWIWNSNFNSIVNLENKIYSCSRFCDDIALKLKYSGINPSLIVIDASVKNTIECCYWELEENEYMLVLATPSLKDDICNIFRK